ncbi:MAG TPA: response regulator [Rhizobacter sp.]|nr:response regulator [Rhizobacter sp.]
MGLLLVAGTWGHLAWVERSNLERLRAQMADRQASSVREFEGWMDQRIRQTQSWANRPDARDLTRALLTLNHPTPDQLANHPLQVAFRQQFAVAQGREGLQGYFIVSLQGLSLGSMGNDNIGTPNLLWKEPEFIQAMRLQGAALSPLMTSDVDLQNVGVSLEGKPVTMFVGVPIYLDSYQPAAYFVIRIPTVGLLGLQGRARFRESGISYLVDNFGRLHADRSWLNLDLERYGLGSEAFRGRPYLFARDPGKNLLEQPGHNGERSQLPLTHSAEALRHGDGASLTPYRDHRGVLVVGSWTWSTKLGLGVITEISAGEAFAPLALARQRVLIAAVVLALSVVLVLLLNLQRSSSRLKAAVIKAESASRAKGVFLANMSHEIRTPLNAVLGIAHLLDGTELQASQREYLQMISASGQALLRILNDILDYSKVEAGKLDLVQAEFALNDIIDTLASIMAVNAAPKDLELVIGIEPAVPSHLSGDSHRLLQVLINLVGNAIKFTLEGEVVLNVSVASRENDTAQLRFEVRDSGVGISAEKQQQLFAPFVQADAHIARSFGGTGLGLAICKRLVELMQGQIGVHSVPGKGSTFWFTLPLHVVHKEADTTATFSPLSPGCALVIDDNDVAREFVAKSLGCMGWKTHEASSGLSAVAELRERGNAKTENFDVVLVDWKMPDMDGLQTSKAIREIAGLTQPPIVIMVTAFSRDQVLQSADAQLVDAVITKPATTSKIFDAVMEARATRSGAAALQTRTPYAPARPVNRLKGLRILLVEDNYINQQVARGVLAAEGSLVRTVDNGALAVDALARNPAAFDLVLMDVQMPVMDGIEATRRLRNDLHLTLPILAMSAGVTQEERQLCQLVGMNDFISKPLEPQVVVQTIRKLNVTPRLDPMEAVLNAAKPATPANAHIEGVDLDALMTAMNGDKAVVDRLLARLEMECGKAMAELEHAIAADDFATMATLMHGFRGGAANMRAEGVVRQAEMLEEALRQDDGEAIRRQFPLFRNAVLALQSALRVARPGLKG